MSLHLDCKEIKPVNPIGDESWVFIGRTDVEAETPIFGHLMRRADSLEKILMLGGIGGASPALAGRFFTTAPPGKPLGGTSGTQ